MYPTNSPADLAQRLSTIRRHLHGLMLAVDALEAEMLALYAPQPEGEQAAQRARSVTYQQGPSEIKIMHETLPDPPKPQRSY